jgi:predicted Zn-dependent protease with MMP-like domain
MDRAEFEEHVERALESLTPELRRAMSNVEIVVEDENRDDPDLFGLYLGVPLTERGEGYAGALPDKIAIYQLPLEEEFGDDPAVLEEEIRVTVLHELAHHFGIDEERLAELGWS